MKDVSKRAPLSPLALSIFAAAKQMFPGQGRWSVDDIDGNPYGVRLSDGGLLIDIFLIVKSWETRASFSPGDSPMADRAAQICVLFSGIGTELPQRMWFMKHRALLESDRDISLN